ncbi:MAG: hypothetical protein AB7S26_10445 [Sandaracinaceae bacterium]
MISTSTMWASASGRARWSAAAGSALLFCGLAAGCDDGDEPGTDAGGTDAGPPPMIDAGYDAGPPLVDAGPPCEGPPGLYEDPACTVIAAGVRAYEPRFTLWADGAEKERYIYLPPGETIDASDPDNWVYPVGTRLYKTFLLGGVRLETRVLEKTDPGTGLTAWRMRVYAWDEAQYNVEDVTNAGLERRSNVLGTDHDIPEGADCVQCHNGTRDLINGFSAIMLNHDGAGVTLETLLDENLLVPEFARSLADVPSSGAGTTAEVDALGYLHANCGHCHHEPLPGSGGVCHTPACNRGLFFWLPTGVATVQATPTYATSVNQINTAPFGGRTCRIKPGDPDNSVIVYRMESRMTGMQMPPLATEQVHTAGVAMVRAFISGMTDAPSAACMP